MKNLKFLPVILALIIYVNCTAQREVRSTGIYFKELGRILEAKELKNEIIDSVGGDVIKFKLANRKGTMRVTEYYGKTGIIKYTGNYSAPVQVNVDSIYRENPENPGEFIGRRIKYYRPVKDGEWTYYSESGTVYKSEFYRNGILSK